LEIDSEKGDTTSGDTKECSSECCGSDLNELYQPGFDHALRRKKQWLYTPLRPTNLDHVPLLLVTLTKCSLLPRLSYLMYTVIANLLVVGAWK